MAAALIEEQKAGRSVGQEDGAVTQVLDDVAWEIEQVCIIQADGTHFYRLTRPGTSGFTALDAVFSPSGRQIAFLGLHGCVRPHDGACGNHPVVLYTMNDDGSHRHAVYTLGPNHSFGFQGLGWQAVP